MKIHNIKQYSDEWFALRKGKLTGSVAKHFISPKTFKVSESKEALTHTCKIIGQFYTRDGQEDLIQTKDMANGIMWEPYAREQYIQSTGNDVLQIGFMESECGRFGMSPDGLINELGTLETEGFIEIKSPNIASYINGVTTDCESELVGKGYIIQILLGFLINPKLQYCDFILFNGDLFKNSLYIKRIHKKDYDMDLFSESVNTVVENISLMHGKFLSNIDALNFDSFNKIPF